MKLDDGLYVVPSTSSRLRFLELLFSRLRALPRVAVETCLECMTRLYMDSFISTYLLSWSIALSRRAYIQSSRALSK